MELSVSDIRELLCGDKSPAHAADHPWEIGANYIIRTVTFHYTGRLVSVGEKWLVLEDVAWIADSGRWAQALETGIYNEVEPFPKGTRVILGAGAIVDASRITTQLPSSQK